MAGFLERALLDLGGDEALQAYRKYGDAGVDFSQIHPTQLRQTVKTLRNMPPPPPPTIYRDNILGGLAEDLDVPQEPMQRWQPAENYSSIVTERIPERMNLMLQDMAAAPPGADRWYDNAALLREFQHHHGDLKGRELFDQHMRLVAGTSSGKPVPQNIVQASDLDDKLQRGLLPHVYSKAESADFLDRNPGYFREGAGSVTQQNDLMLGGLMARDPRYAFERAIQSQSPQKIFSFQSNLTGNLNPATLDRHEAHFLNTPFETGKDGKRKHRQLRTNEYVLAEPYYKGMAEMMSPMVGRRMSPAQVQGLRWTGGGPRTGVKSTEPTFVHEYEEVVKRAADTLGISPQELLAEHIKYRAYLGDKQ